VKGRRRRRWKRRLRLAGDRKGTVSNPVPVSKRHDPSPRGPGWEGARAEHSGRCAGKPTSRARQLVKGATGPRAIVGEEHPGACPNRIARKGTVLQRNGRFGESQGRGNPKGARSIGGGNTFGARPESGARPRGRATKELRFHRSNGEEAGSLVTGHPLRSGRTSKGRGRSEECRWVWCKPNRSAGNRANPRTGCRVQQTCEAVCGGSRRSREERQGRNVFGCGKPEPRATESGRIRRYQWRGGL
jgi:hypothetical protein